MTRRVEIAAWMVALVAAMAGAISWRGGSRDAALVVPAADAPAPGSVSRGSPDSLAARAASTVRRNPFRLDRVPANVRFGAEAAGTPARAAAPRPRLFVTGIFGPPWHAVVEGIPGREGSLVIREGQALGELLVRSIGRDTVVIAGADTTWRLAVRRPW